MSTTTTNLGLVKPALTDSPPDITAINPNFDAIDNLGAYGQEVAVGKLGTSTVYRRVLVGDMSAEEISILNIVAHRLLRFEARIRENNNGRYVDLPLASTNVPGTSHLGQTTLRLYAPSNVFYGTGCVYTVLLEYTKN